MLILLSGLFFKSVCKISRARAAHLGIGDPLLWAVVTLLQGKSCVMSTVILFRYCICDLFSILCNMLFVVNVANKANGTLNYLKVATLGNFGDYSYTVSDFTLKMITNPLLTTCKPFIKAPGCLFTLNVDLYLMYTVFLKAKISCAGAACLSIGDRLLWAAVLLQPGSGAFCFCLQRARVEMVAGHS